MQSNQFYHESDNDEVFTEELYAAMHNKDLSELVFVAQNKLKQTNSIPPLIKIAKSEVKSTKFRKEGNAAYGVAKFQEAFELYNKALLYAPKKSRSMKLAVSNRSALLFKARAYMACLEDIDICFSLGCPPDIELKLTKRKEDAMRYIYADELADDDCPRSIAYTFFTMRLRRNPQIPCTSIEVGVVMESDIPKIVAVRDIKVGTLVAKETPFTSYTNKLNYYASCYYCHKMSLNLMPCDGCCVALFCDEGCMELSMEEEHSIECPFMEAIEAVSTGPFRIAQKAALKMRKQSRSWEELIIASREMGIKRMKNSSIDCIFAEKQPFSLLSFKEEKHFTHGLKYNAAFSCAVIMHYLEFAPSFLPENSDQKLEAIRALSRIMMFLAVYPTHVQMIPLVTIAFKRKTEMHKTPNFGLYSFIGKLRNSCTPNLIAVTLNKDTALVAVEPIKRGTELTIAYLGHWLDKPMCRDVRKSTMFRLAGFICNCIICTGHVQLQRTYMLNDAQRNSLHNLRLGSIPDDLNPEEVPDLFTHVCNALSVFHEMPFSREYGAIYNLFKKCILLMQKFYAPNHIVDLH